MVTKRGIEANSKKMKATQKMQSLWSVQEVQRLVGCVSALSCFISHSADLSLLFFKIL